MSVVVVRADASAVLGGGHVIRCASLALALKARGARVMLAARPGAIAPASFVAGAYDDILNLPDDDAAAEPAVLRAALSGGCDLLVVDHYQRDHRFESACRGWAARILALDDLADRAHDCDLLVDQTLGRDPADYRARVPPGATILTGPRYATLRPDFAALRPAALARRRAVTGVGAGQVARVQISIGSTDPFGTSLTALRGLALLDRPLAAELVLGPAAPCLAAAQALAAQGLGRLDVTLAVGVSDMAARMAACDLAIGAGGATSWERGCLGAPALLVQTADNQAAILAAVVAAGAARSLGDAAAVTPSQVAAAVAALIDAPAELRAMSAAAAGLCDGRGAERLAAWWEKERAA